MAIAAPGSNTKRDKCRSLAAVGRRSRDTGSAGKGVRRRLTTSVFSGGFARNGGLPLAAASLRLSMECGAGVWSMATQMSACARSGSETLSVTEDALTVWVPSLLAIFSIRTDRDHGAALRHAKYRWAASRLRSATLIVET
jgi:hypothetical protein